MKNKLLKGIVWAACGACFLMPMTAAANQAVLKEKNLYEIRTLTGQNQPGYSDGAAQAASLYTPASIIELNNGGILISDSDNHLLRLLSSNQVTSYSGLILDFDEQGFPIGAYNDGNNDSAFYNKPAGLAQDVQGNIYVADSGNHSIRMITTDGIVKTIAGNGEIGFQDGTGERAKLYSPSDVAVDHKGNVYVADTLNHVIRKIDANGAVTTLNKRSERVVEYFPGVVTEAGDFKDGRLSEALFNEPTGLAIDELGNLYVSDSGNQRIRYIDFEQGIVKTVAGGGEYERNALYAPGAYANGEAEQARFSSPTGISVASDGSLLIADRNNHVIRLLADGIVYTLAGQEEESGKSDGVIGAAELNEPTDVIERSDGTLLVTDSSNNRLRVIQRYEQQAHDEDGNIHVMVEGKLLVSDVAAKLQGGRTYVPLRALAEHFGYRIHVDKQSSQVRVTINSSLSYLFSEDGQSIVKQTSEGTETLDASGIVVDHRLLVPVRFIAEQLGYDVQWDRQQQHVVVRSALFQS
ncbi:stalk domain-containing protein [Paenibacillus camelliae]|uniref:NHL domain-containing protein n=1 Tax=Paenibacillus camelliae TaxID=512410 RepID=UPI00203EF0FD|nr:stalk domain-containing protein [Paenibacillus camelliae]MCM3634387.1 stalk domain-containing protein [Paenibacillus camelliae]